VVPAAVRREVERLLADAPAHLRGAESAAARARELIERVAIPAWLEQAVGDAYARLAGRCQSAGDVATAVRSSGVAEDGAASSYAGQYDTYLGVRGAGPVLEHVRRCWASQYTARAAQYRRRQRAGATRDGMAVGVLALVEARASGVAFSLDPVTGSRSRVVVEAGWGLGEAIVSGRVTPDRWVLDRASTLIVEETISDQAVELALAPTGSGVVERPVPEARRGAASLAPDEVERIARTVVALADQEGAPQDMEWAVDGRTLYVLQHRPETVWATQPAAPDPAPYDPVQYALRNVFHVPEDR
jgi:pyruvate, water dikinase